MELDAIDREILASFGRQGRITWLALADEVGLSPSAATERVRRLERAGVIAGSHAEVASGALGRPLEARIAATLEADTDRGRFLRALESEPAVVDAVHLTGPHDYEVTVRCADTDELDGLLTRLKERHHVERTDTRIVLANPIRRAPDPRHR